MQFCFPAPDINTLRQRPHRLVGAACRGQGVTRAPPLLPISSVTERVTQRLDSCFVICKAEATPRSRGPKRHPRAE